MNERLNTGRLGIWALIAVSLSALNFAAYTSASAADSPSESLFSWSFAGGNAIFLCIWIVISLAISNGHPELRALRLAAASDVLAAAKSLGPSTDGRALPVDILTANLTNGGTRHRRALKMVRGVEETEVQQRRR